MKIAVVGVGLIGGSIALAARERGLGTVSGFEPDRTAADWALEHGLIDEAAATLAQALDGAQVAFVAAPLGALPDAIAATLAAASLDCVVSDVGSTKRTLLSQDERFVGGHPLAGGESAGPRAARADLFQGATWYLTPVSMTSGILLERLHRFITALGARPAAVDAADHDRMMAAVSHLPHVFANLLVQEAAGSDVLPAVGPSFRDAVRVAGAHPALWADIMLANRDALLASVDRASGALDEVRELLRDGDRGALEAWQAAAADRRNALLGAGVLGGPTRSVLIAVPNRPGVVADIALALGRAGINIADLSLLPSPDMTRGEVTVWVGEGDASRARALVEGLGFDVA